MFFAFLTYPSYICPCLEGLMVSDGGPSDETLINGVEAAHSIFEHFMEIPIMDHFKSSLTTKEVTDVDHLKFNLKAKAVLMEGTVCKHYLALNRICFIEIYCNKNFLVYQDQ